VTYTLEDLTRLIAKHNFCVLATQGRDGPHVAGVGYFARGLDIYIPTGRKTVKALNLRRSPHVAVHIPVPWPLIPAPPRSIQFQGIAEVLPFDDAEANAALERAPLALRIILRRLARRSDTELFGENIWVRVRPRRRIETFMIGVSMTTILRDEKKAIQHFEVPTVPNRESASRSAWKGEREPKAEK